MFFRIFSYIVLPPYNTMNSNQNNDIYEIDYTKIKLSIIEPVGEACGVESTEEIRKLLDILFQELDVVREKLRSFYRKKYSVCDLLVKSENNPFLEEENELWKEFKVIETKIHEEQRILLQH